MLIAHLDGRTSAHVHYFLHSEMYPLGYILEPKQVPVRVRIAKKLLTSDLGLVRISKNTNSTVSKSEGVQDGT